MNELQEQHVTLNRSQARIHLINANVTHCLWPRGGGKTEGGAGPRILHLSETMPRSQCIFYSDTYERIHDRLIPNIINFLQNELGLVEDEDFVKFKRPPVTWTKPLIQPTKYDHVISFATGFSLCCASAKVEGSANGFNAQSAIVDEAKFVKEIKIKGELLRALRGARKYFEHLPEYRSYWTFTDKFEGDIKWILQIREKQNQKLVDAVFSLQLEIIKLQKEQQQFQSLETQYKYINRIKAIELKLTAVRKELVWVSDALPFENIDILGEKYYRDQKRDCQTIYEYDIAVGNKDPTKAQYTFYPTLAEDNFYYLTDTETDIILGNALIAAFDFNYRITPMVVGQFGKLPGNTDISLNVVASVHALYPDGIKEVIERFAELFITHQRKVIHFIYDHTAIGRDPARDSFDKQVIKYLKANKWKVIIHYIGQAPQHGIKFEKIKGMLLKRGLNGVYINQVRNRFLISALYQAGTLTLNGQTKKDKTKEKDTSYPAEEATDYTDAFDTLLWGALELKVIKSDTSVPMGSRIS